MNRMGLSDLLSDLNQNAEVLHEPVYLKGESDGIQVEAAFQFTNEFQGECTWILQQYLQCRRRYTPYRI